MRIRSFYGLLAVVLLSATAASSQTLHFLKHQDSLIVSECDFGANLRIGIWNSADTEQYIRGEEGTPLRLALYQMTAVFRDGYYRVGPGDTVWAYAFPFTVLGTKLKADTIVLGSDGGDDTLFLALQSYRDSITISGVMPGGMIPSNEVVTQAFTLTNRGTHPFPLARLSFSGLTLPDSLKLDSLQEGETRTISTIIMNEYPGRYEAVVAVSSCEQEYGRSQFRVYDPRAYFINDRLIDTLDGCANILEGHDVTLTLMNEKGPQTIIKSISTYGTPGLRLADSSWKGASIQSGESIAIRFRRELSEFAWTDVVLETMDGVRERAHIESSLRWTKPRFYVDIDTLRLHGSGTDHFFDQFWLTADGNVPSVITSLSISDSVHWEVSGVDVGDTLGTKRLLLLGETRFKGASTSGEYPVTLRISTKPCDTILVRTVIMKVTASGIPGSETRPVLRVYPLPASSLLHVEVPIGSEIRLLDLLGNEVLSTTAHSSTSDLDVRKLNSGSYILVVNDLGKRESRRVTIER